MGDDDFDRNPPSSSSQSVSNSGSGRRYSKSSVQAMTRHEDEPDPSVLMVNRTAETDSRSPTILLIDHTGSMGEDSYVLYGKMPMVWRHLKTYLGEDAAVAVGMVGDAYSDRWPLQLGNFVRGGDIDTEMKKLFIEGNGGGQGNESYALMAYALLNACKTPNAENPFVFIIADEGFFPEVNSQHIKKHLGISAETVKSLDVFKMLMERFNVFLIHREYRGGARSDSSILEDWRNLLGEDHVFVLGDDPNAVADIMLGAIALTSKARSLEQYLADMENRDQEADRIRDVKKIIKPYSDSLALVPTVDAIPDKKGAGMQRTRQSTRL